MAKFSFFVAAFLALQLSVTSNSSAPRSDAEESSTGNRITSAEIANGDPNFGPEKTPAEEPTIISVTAYPGEPFGVGKVSFRIPESDQMIANTGAIRIVEKNNRIFYPTFSSGFLGRLLGGGGPDSEKQINVWFLFVGDDPLEAKIIASNETEFDIRPETPRRRIPVNIMWRTWWREYNKAFQDNDDYPPSFEVYLTSMLGKRLGLQPTVAAAKSQNPSQMKQTLELLFSVEAVRARAISELMTSGVDRQVNRLPLPPTVTWRDTIVAPPATLPKTEAFAKYVPRECFYVRFGTWQNQIWLKNLMADYGGDLSRMLQFRGHSYPGQEKLMGQLALESSGVDDMFGGTVVADVAFIGTDLYSNDGATAGIMFESKNKLFVNNLNSRRSAMAKKLKDKGVTLEEFKIGDAEVTFLNSPDNRTRSFLVTADNIHLVTNSRYLVERFLQASRGIGSLSDEAEFLNARNILPLERDDTLFVYFSSDFFHNLMSPKYQIELRRRSLLTAEVQILQLATLAAANEGVPIDRLEDLIEFGFLPENFGYRADGGRLNFDTQGFSDSIRGARGYFLPIADVQIDEISENENAWYAERAAYYSDTLKRVDPMFGAVQRFELEGNVERLVFEARIAPFAKEKYSWLTDRLGPPTKYTVSSAPDDVLRFESSLDTMSLGGSKEPHLIFAAVQNDTLPQMDLRPTNFLQLIQTLKTTPGYLGAWPKPGYLDFLPRLGGQPDEQGYTYSRLLDLWRLQQEEFSLLSFDRQRLENARDFLEIEPTERKAQIRLDVKDLSTSNLVNWVNNINYRVSWNNSVSNVELLNILTSQFGVEPAKAKLVAEDVLGLTMICNLGGPYALTQLDSGREVWRSESWPSFNNPTIETTYNAPILGWFRGTHVEATEENGQFLVYGWIDIQRKESQKKSGFKLPSFSMFNGFKKAEPLPKKEKDGKEKNAESEDKTTDKSSKRSDDKNF